MLHDDANRLTEALNYYLLSLNLNKEINDKREMAANMVNIASVYSKLNNFSAAYKNINDALKIYTVLRDDYNIAALLNEKGKIYVDCPASFLEDQNIKSINDTQQL